MQIAALMILTFCFALYGYLENSALFKVLTISTMVLALVISVARSKKQMYKEERIKANPIGAAEKRRARKLKMKQEKESQPAHRD